ncbi:hypothetical protein HDV01_004360 [Terramyces sp. JEL0728]|nr:hypothetical protein HDV01_004360 [Terramyces sp. JEL0728]
MVAAEPLTGHCQTYLSNQKTSILTNCGGSLDLNVISGFGPQYLIKQVADNLATVCQQPCADAINNFQQLGNCSTNVADTASGYTIGQLAAVAIIAQTSACVQYNDEFCLTNQVAELPDKPLNETARYFLSNKTIACTNCTLKQIQAVDALPLANMDAAIAGPVYQISKSVVDFCGFANIQTGNSTTPSKSSAVGIKASAILSAFLFLQVI